VGQIIVFTDLRKVKKLEKKLRQADKLKAVGELAAGIAHEIRNPLAAISGSIEMLVDCTDGDEANRRLFEVVLKESSRLNDIIEGFLNYTRPKPPDLQRVDVSELLEEVVLLMSNDPAVSTGIKISIDRRSDEVEIEGDPGQLKQVFINLIKNAADAIGECGEIRISVARDPGGRSLNVVVSDTGCGMDESQLKDVFNPFFTTKANGMGIGLSVAEKLIRSHGGQISVESRMGEGTAFTISLPCRREQGQMAGIEAYGENTHS
jgi:two-component system sensor histidine kinase PilS (NtrC family)